MFKTQSGVFIDSRISVTDTQKYKTPQCNKHFSSSMSQGICYLEVMLLNRKLE